MRVGTGGGSSKIDRNYLRRNSMQILFALTLAACAMLTAGWGQQIPAHKPSRAELLTWLRSDNAEVRSEALDRLRTDPVALRDPKVKAALVNQLDRENRETLYAEEEDYAGYLSWLVDTVAKVVDWSNPRQVCILANGAYLTDELADHAKVAVPCLLQRFKNAAAPPRGAAVAMLVQALSKGRGELDAVTIQAVRQIILSALHDPDDVVKIPTVKALGSFGGEDMIPALRNVVETDPDPSEGYAIRKWAAEAIAAIQKRAGQQQQ
jgi:HEAT repeats